MVTLNQITLIGFTGSEAEVHYTQNGTMVAVVSVATKESWKDSEGEWQNRTDWHRVVIYGIELAAQLFCLKAVSNGDERSSVASLFRRTRQGGGRNDIA